MSSAPCGVLLNCERGRLFHLCIFFLALGSLGSPGVHASASASVDYTQYVSPLLGAEGGGNTFPGATRPWGIVKIGPDLYSGSDAYSGYLATGNVTSFTLTHESGTGGAPKYGVVGQMPWIGSAAVGQSVHASSGFSVPGGVVGNPLLNLTSPRQSSDTATVGHYIANLTIGVDVELAAADRAGMIRYSFHTGGLGQRQVVVDVSHVLPSFRGQGLGQNYLGGGFQVFKDGHYEANGTYNNGWNRAPNWKIYSCGRFSTMPIQSLVFVGQGSTLTSYGTLTAANGTSRLGAVFTFGNKTTTVESRIGVSFISSNQACANLDHDIPASMSFDDLVGATKKAWNDQVLSKIIARTNNATQLQLMYTMLYGAFLIPSNKTDENPLWNSVEPYYDDTFTLWDLNRCSTAMWNVLQPTFYEEYVRSLIDVFRYEGYMPDARSSFFNGRTQGGSNADNVLADAYIKGVGRGPGGRVNWTDGYAAMVKNAEVTPINNFDPQASDSSTKEGRGALPDWKKYGWITPTYSRAVSRAVEYAVNDFSLYQVASGLGNHADATKYLNRSAQWRNHWNPKVASLGFSGFLVPRNADGSFLAQDPLSCGGCYWSDPYYEALPWEYSFAAIHDVATMVNFSGGADTFTRRLDTFFQPGNNPPSATGTALFNYTLMNPSNEPDFTTPYLYHFVGRPDLSVQRSKFIANSYYSTGKSGLPGNSDAGAMETWWLWNTIGLYPITGQTTFLIHAPLFGMNVDLDAGKWLNITVSYTGGTGSSTTTGYQVQSLRVNGSDWKQSWATYSDLFAHGATMNFVLGKDYGGWFNGSALPPSPGQAGTV